jgi:hypothetical protein
MTRWSRRVTSTASDADRGAALLLAIGFVLLVSAIAAALAALITSSTSNSITLEKIRNRQYAADAAVHDAITKIRISDRATAPTCGYQSELNNVEIRVDCANAITVLPSADNQVLGQRNVIFVACPDTGSACLNADVIIRAQVNFEQRFDGEVTRTYIQSWSVNR